MWRITGIPLLVFLSGLTIIMLMEREPNVLAAAPGLAAQHLTQLQQLRDAWIERLSKGGAK